MGYNPNGSAVTLNTSTAAATTVASGIGTLRWVTSGLPCLYGGFAASGSDVFYVLMNVSNGGFYPELRRLTPGSGSVTSLGNITSGAAHGVRGMTRFQGVLYGVNHPSGWNNSNGDSGAGQLITITTSGPGATLIGNLPANMSGIAGNLP